MNLNINKVLLYGQKNKGTDMGFCFFFFNEVKLKEMILTFLHSYKYKDSEFINTGIVTKFQEVLQLPAFIILAEKKKAPGSLKLTQTQCLSQTQNDVLRTAIRHHRVIAHTKLQRAPKEELHI